MFLNPAYLEALPSSATFIGAEAPQHLHRSLGNIQAKGTNTKIAIDGAISPEVIERLSDKVEYFILGSAGLFGKPKSYADTMQDLRALGEKAVA
ncbi:hypothetical protein [Vibrio owensii]